jgi:hypothetical protein
VVRKKLGLDLSSQKVDGDRTLPYRQQRKYTFGPPSIAASRGLSAMSRVTIDRVVPDKEALDNEIAQCAISRSGNCMPSQRLQRSCCAIVTQLSGLIVLVIFHGAAVLPMSCS